ncbi:hypothetical protein GCM10027020_08040 [Nocardioides salsibiostraticola]
MTDSGSHEFWRYLLRARRGVTWGNFAWFSPKTLLLSINDQVAKRIESPDGTGSIVDRRRIRWLATQAAHQVASPDHPLRAPDSTGVLVLGDPGEMDASQYVLVRDLARHQRTLRDSGVDVALLMSDVIYPAGDINAWADAVYLPYLGQPGAAWGNALNAWARQASADGFSAPLKDWHLLAMPGNHDWYDGLNGFMFHACGAEALPEVGYDTQSLTFRERVAQSLWRKPAPPQRELLDRIRRRHAQEPLGIPHLPGPYYAVDLGCSRDEDHQHDDECPALLRLVMVDNGVTGSIDVEQAAWLRRMVSPDVSLPKIVVTGIPIAVNNKLNWLRVADPDLDLVHPTEIVDNEVLSILKGNPSVVATLAGDIHNYQRIDFTASTEAKGLADEGGPPLQIVSGGAGAFLSAAHPVKFTEDQLVLTHEGHRKVSSDGARTTIAARGHVRFPTREGSLSHYSSRTRSYLWVLLFLLVVDVVSLVMATRRVVDLRDPPSEISERARSLPDYGWLVDGPWLMLLGVVLLIVVVGLLLGRIRKARLPPVISGVPAPPPGSIFVRFGDWMRRTVLAIGVVAVVAGSVAIVAIKDSASFLSAVVGLVVILGLLMAQFIPYLVQSFPRLGRSWVVLAGAGLVAYRVATVDPIGRRLFDLLATSVVIAVVVIMGVLVHKKSTAWLTRRSFLSPGNRLGLVLMQLVPWGVVALGLLLAFEGYPTFLLETVGFENAALAAQVGRVLYWTTLAFLCTVLVGASTLLPLAKARSAIPWLMWATLVLFTVSAGVFSWLLVVAKAPDAGDSWHVALVVLAVAVAPALGIVVWLSPYLRKLPKPDAEELRSYLGRRDGGDRPGARSRSTVAAALVGAIPGLESMAEASTPPFAKNVLVVQHEHDGIHFRAYGLNNESPSTAEEQAPLPTEPPPDSDGDGPTHGFFLLDHVKVDPQNRQVEVLQTWSALQHHIPPEQRRAADHQIDTATETD